MRRRLDPPGNANFWPAFTDVMGALLVLMIFLMTLFVMAEVLFSREIAKQDATIGQLSDVTSLLEGLLGEKENKTQLLRDELIRTHGMLQQKSADLEEAQAQLLAARMARQQLENSLSRQRSQLDEMRVSSDLQSQQIVSLQTRLDTADQEKQELQQRHLTQQISLSLAESQQALLSTRIERLTAEFERLNRILGEKEAELTESRSELVAAQAANERQQSVIASQGDRIDELDAQIKRHLLAKVEQLQNYASDFFGRLRQVFSDNPDIKIVGDRFVFQSEVLFPSGQADLSRAGRSDLDKFVQVYRQLEPAIPPDLPVVIEVQGHTDDIPIHNDQFSSNWELSFARALGVVNYLISAGIPANRLAASGMGEHYPVLSDDSAASKRKNRRIELKITSR